jgi:hypothetical protein
VSATARSRALGPLVAGLILNALVGGLHHPKSPSGMPVSLELRAGVRLRVTA